MQNDRLLETMAEYSKIIKNPGTPNDRKAEAFAEIGLMCCRMNEYKRAHTFFNLSIFANPLSETPYIQKLKHIERNLQSQHLFSVVMPTYSRYHDLLRTVQCIRNNSYFPVQIVVVADRCDDGTVEFVQSENEKEDFIGLINDTRMGSVHSLKLALYLAEGDYVCILNDDVQVMPGWDLEVFLTIDIDPNAGCAVPLVVNSDGTVQSVGQHNSFISRKYDWIGQVPAVDHGSVVGKYLIDFPMFHHPRLCDYGYFPVLKRECLLQIGYIDDNYRHYYVDPDIGYRIQKHGWESIYCPTSVFVHHHKSMDELGQMGVWEKARPDMIYYFKKWDLYTPK
jgi:GT2 family glycosyltransferase